MFLKNSRLKPVFFLLIFFLLATPLTAANAAEQTSSNVLTISGNTLTNETATIVGDTRIFNTGVSYTVTTTEEFISKLSEAIGTCSDAVTINYQGSTSVGAQSTFLQNAIKDALQIAGNDYEKILVKTWQISYTTSSPTFTATYQLTYLETAAQRQAVTDKVNEILANIITPEMTEEQKEKAINEYICLNIAYDTSLVQHSAYAALFGNKKTVCQGYALLAYKMLTTAGFEARIITGNAGGPHAWNMVKVGGNWYHLDCTWNDPIPDTIGRVSYKYFNLPDNKLSSRTWDATKYPAATTTYVPQDPTILQEFVNVNSTDPVEANITVTNNVGLSDTIKVVSLAAGDIIKVYDASTAGKLLGSVTVAAGKTDATVTVLQLGKTAANVYVTKTSTNKLESNRVAKAYDAEPVTTSPAAENITVTNNTPAADSIKVTGLTAGDVVKAYTAASGGTQLGSATAATSQTSATISVTQLGKLSGNVYISVTSKGKNESDRTEVSFPAEQITSDPIAENITINNYAGASDTIKVTGLIPGNVVKIYDAATLGKVIGSSTVAAGKTEAIVTISQIGKDGGNVYITVTATNKLESSRVAKEFAAEEVSPAPDAANIIVSNNTPLADTVKVSGLTTGDIVKVYSAASGGTQLGTVTVAASQTTAIVSVPQLGKLSGNVYVTVTNKYKLESSRTEVAFAAEQVSSAPDQNKILVINSKSRDVAIIYGLSPGDIVKIYGTGTDTVVKASGVVAANQKHAVIYVTQLGLSGGNIYVSVTSTNKLESTRTEKAFSAE